MNGFLLTRQWRDTRYGIELVFWVSTQSGPVRIVIPAQQAVCFIRQSNRLRLPEQVMRKPLSLKNFQHQPVDGLYFNSQRELDRLREHLAHDKSQLFESEIKPAERYLMERFITAPMEITPKPGPSSENSVSDRQTLINPLIKPAEFDPDLGWVSIDIETSDLRGKLYSIAAVTDKKEVVFLVNNQKSRAIADRHHRKSSNPACRIHWCESEAQALKRFFDWIRENDPDVIIGWNVIGFDLDFLQWKCRQLGIPFILGRGNTREAAQCVVLPPRQSGHVSIARIPGRVVLDGIAALRAAFWSFESFSLGHVAKQLLGRDKLIPGDALDDDMPAINTSGKLDEIRRLYQEDPQQLAEYNLEDCRLVADIFKVTDLINFSIERARMTGLAMDRQGGSTAAFDHLYLPALHREGYVAPDIGSQTNQAHSPGGYVMDSAPGLYDNVLVLDFKSLYPSIIRTFKIDPLGLVLCHGNEPNEPCSDAIPGFLGAVFARERHLLPEIVSRLWRERDRAKKEQNKPLSHAVKIIMNSFYGVLGSSGCRFFNPQLASSITRRGHEIIQRSQDYIEKQGYKVIYGDTDSLFVLVGAGQTEHACQRIGRQLQDGLNRWWTQQLKTQFQLESALEIEFETHYLRFLMPTIRGTDKGSKKRYAGTVRSKTEINGSLKTRLVFKGLESVRSDWTALAREFQQELYRRVFDNKPYEKYIRRTCALLQAGELDNKLVYTKRLRRPLNTYTSTQPPQVKAAKKMRSPGRIIRYVITLNGPEPIENIESVLDYQHYLDKQLAPVADAILYFLDTSFDKITARQLDVFDSR